jgi:prepilin peptidase CpaA
MHSFAWWPTLIVLAVATFTDLRSRRIPNWLVFPFLLLGILVSPWRPDWNPGPQGFALHGFGWHGVAQSFEGFGLGFLIFGFLYFFAGMGAGDVKLCAAIGAWIGPAQMGFAAVYTAMAGGVIILCWAAVALVRDRFARIRKRSSVSAEGGPIQEREPVLQNLLKRKMAYAPAIAVGTLLSFFAR